MIHDKKLDRYNKAQDILLELCEKYPAEAMKLACVRATLGELKGTAEGQEIAITILKETKIDDHQYQILPIIVQI